MKEEKIKGIVELFVGIALLLMGLFILCSVDKLSITDTPLLYFISSFVILVIACLLMFIPMYTFIPASIKKITLERGKEK